MIVKLKKEKKKKKYFIFLSSNSNVGIISGLLKVFVYHVQLNKREKVQT